MRKNMLLRTNIFICFIIIMGFLVTSFISYHSNIQIFKKDIEEVSTLTSEGIYHKIDSVFTEPINVSLTMANDTLLKDFLNKETQHTDDKNYIQQMQNYLDAYRQKYGYDSVFLVSTKTNRYYHYHGLDRVLEKDNSENEWYYKFLNSKKEYDLKIDNDEVENANNEITVFINCRIKDENQLVIGVVGVGFRVKNLQALLAEYEEQYSIQTYLVNEDGIIEISSTETGYKQKSLFDNEDFLGIKNDILKHEQIKQDFWYTSGNKKGYMINRYIEKLNWYLLIDYDTSALQKNLNLQIFGALIVIILVITAVLIIITKIVKKYNEEIIAMTQRYEKEHRDIFQETTQQLYQKIIEIDLTHNRLGNLETQEYFESLGVPKNTPYDEALRYVAKKQIKAEYQEGYIQTFLPENVLRCYEEGQESIVYDFMISDDGTHYYWMRITARIFTWEEDNSIRMFSYRQNIDEQKSQERKMLENLEHDHLSTLYNKKTTQDKIVAKMKHDPGRMYAFFILDIDAFKLVNDRFGHAIGDKVIADFAHILKNQFRENDIVGRIGGDEFAVFVEAKSFEMLRQKAAKLVKVLHHNFVENDVTCPVSTSIGIAVSPMDGKDFETLYRHADKALYQTKKKGKNGFTLYRDI